MASIEACCCSYTPIHQSIHIYRLVNSASRRRLFGSRPPPQTHASYDWSLSCSIWTVFILIMYRPTTTGPWAAHFVVLWIRRVFSFYFVQFFVPSFFSFLLFDFYSLDSGRTRLSLILFTFLCRGPPFFLLCLRLLVYVFFSCGWADVLCVCIFFGVSASGSLPAATLDTSLRRAAATRRRDRG